MIGWFYYRGEKMNKRMLDLSANTRADPYNEVLCPYPTKFSTTPPIHAGEKSLFQKFIYCRKQEKFVLFPLKL